MGDSADFTFSFDHLASFPDTSAPFPAFYSLHLLPSSAQRLMKPAPTP